MSAEEWLIFITACTVLNLAPGPDTIYITSRTMAQGKISGFLSALGVCTGAMLHALAAGIGLSMILTTSAFAFGVIKWLGAAYFFYLGYKAIRGKSSTKSFHPTDNIQSSNNWSIYFQGILVDLLNPKTALFFLAFIPQFIDVQQGPQLSQFLILGLVVIVDALIIEYVLIMFADKLSIALRRNHQLTRWLECGMGTIMIALGFRLARQEL